VSTHVTTSIDSGLYSYLGLPSSYIISPNGAHVAHLKDDSHSGVGLWLATTNGASKRLVFDVGTRLLANLASAKFSPDSK